MNTGRRRLRNLLGLATRPRPEVGATPADVVLIENKMRVLRYRRAAATTKFRVPVLLVPSLINRHYVLDLMPGKSLVEWLVARGHDVFIIDWGTPAPEDRYLTFDDICGGYLGRAIRKVASYSGTGKTHVLGYCLGGTLAAIHTAAFGDYVATLLLIAAPVCFSTSTPGLLEAWTQTPSFDIPSLVEAFGNVPWQLMQGAFHLLRPTMNLAKAVHVLDRAWNDEFLDGFLAIETWSNDNVAFPGACYQTYVESLYRRDELARGEFCLRGVPARLSQITCPLFAITFQHDTIVPDAAATAIVDLVRSQDRTHLRLAGGHVGAVVSKSAADRLWPKLSGFWALRDGI